MHFLKHIKHKVNGGNFALSGEVMWEKRKSGILVAQSPWMKNKIVAKTKSKRDKPKRLKL